MAGEISRLKKELAHVTWQREPGRFALPARNMDEIGRANPTMRATGPPAEPVCTSRIEHDAAMLHYKKNQYNLDLSLPRANNFKIDRKERNR